jgi:hypothetical protein
VENLSLEALENLSPPGPPFFLTDKMRMATIEKLIALLSPAGLSGYPQQVFHIALMTFGIALLLGFAMSIQILNGSRVPHLFFGVAVASLILLGIIYLGNVAFKPILTGAINAYLTLICFGPTVGLTRYFFGKFSYRFFIWDLQAYGFKRIRQNMAPGLNFKETTYIFVGEPQHAPLPRAIARLAYRSDPFKLERLEFTENMMGNDGKLDRFVFAYNLEQAKAFTYKVGSFKISPEAKAYLLLQAFNNLELDPEKAEFLHRNNYSCTDARRAIHYDFEELKNYDGVPASLVADILSN